MLVWLAWFCFTCLYTVVNTVASLRARDTWVSVGLFIIWMCFVMISSDVLFR